MAKASTSPELKAGFEKHLQQTEEHVERLEQIFTMMGEKPGGKKCLGMEGLVKEGGEMILSDLPETEINCLARHLIPVTLKSKKHYWDGEASHVYFLQHGMASAQAA